MKYLILKLILAIFHLIFLIFLLFTGILVDGPNSLKETVIARQAVNMTSDLDNQLVSSTVSFQFSGFESALHGGMRFEVAVGTQPIGEDVLPFTLANIVHMEQPDIVCHVSVIHIPTESREIFASYYFYPF